MIKEAIEKILSLAAPEIKEIDGIHWARERLIEVKKDKAPSPEVLELHTLTGLVDYITQHPDCAGQYLVHVADYDKVRLYGEYETEYGRRKQFVAASCEIKSFRFGNYLPQEDFVVALHHQFSSVGDREQVLAEAGNVAAESQVTQKDDGVSQEVAMRDGVARLTKSILTNPVSLAPFRTFPEIDPVESQMTFRMRKDDNKVLFALFEADGENWKVDSIHAIRDYLKEKLSDEVIIIA